MHLVAFHGHIIFILQEIDFQFPLLGIFPCIATPKADAACYTVTTFNSLYLGFSLASKFAIPFGIEFL